MNASEAARIVRKLFTGTDVKIKGKTWDFTDLARDIKPFVHIVSGYDYKNETHRENLAQAIRLGKEHGFIVTLD